MTDNAGENLLPSEAIKKDPTPSAAKAEIEVRVRTLRKRVEDQSEIIEKIVNDLIGPYSNDLNDLMERMRSMLKRSREMATSELEEFILKVPAYTYYASEGLETLGVEGDLAKAAMQEKFNILLKETDARNAEQRRSEAEIGVFTEKLVEIAFTRAYRKLKGRIESADNVFTSVKKVYSKRIAEIEAELNDPLTKPQPRGDRRRVDE